VQDDDLDLDLTGTDPSDATPERTPDPAWTPPAAVIALAAERADARAARDWGRADALKDRIEAAGWKVEDAGRAYSLLRVAPVDVVVDGEPRYGSSRSVPSVLDEPPTANATVLLVAEDDASAIAATLGGVGAHLPAGAQVVVVANAPSPEADEALQAALAGAVGTGLTGAAEAAHSPGDPGATCDPTLEVVRTAARLGHAAALNAGLRRSRGAVAILADGSLVPAGDTVTPVIAALADPAVAVAGATGLTGDDLAHLAPSGFPGPDAIGAGWLAFRRGDYGRLGPLDERFVAPEHLDAWWSLTLRAGAEGEAPRRAALVELALVPGASAAASGPGAERRARLARRNVYRLLDSFRDRPDLLTTDGPSQPRSRR
jgi:hypothetical protein